MPDDAVELVAVQHEKLLAVRRRVDGVALHDDLAEPMADELARELVVVAGDVDHPSAFARLAQQLLDDVVVRLLPIPTLLERPPIEHVADQIPALGVDVFEEVEQQVGSTVARA